MHLHSTSEVAPSQDVSYWPPRSNLLEQAAGRGRGPCPAGAGLSIAHNRPLLACDYSLVVYPGSSLVSLRAPGASLAGGGRRGVVSTFSPSSRRYLLHLLARVPLDAPMCHFITLTLPDSADWAAKRCKRHLKAFVQRLRRSFPASSGVWRIELKARKSGARIGEIAPHYHLLVWGLADKVKKVIAWVSRAWYEVVGSGDLMHLQAGTSVERVRSARGAWFYCSKYIGKVDQVVNAEVGRWWGRFGDIPQAEGVAIAVDRRDYYRLLRLGRRQVRNGRVRSFFVKADTWLYKVFPFVVGGQQGRGSLAEIDDFAKHIRAGHRLIEGRWMVFVPAGGGGEMDDLRSMPEKHVPT